MSSSYSEDGTALRVHATNELAVLEHPVMVISPGAGTTASYDYGSMVVM